MRGGRSLSWRAAAALAGGLMLAACGGRIVPPDEGARAPVRRSPTYPVQPYRPSQTGMLPRVTSIVPATPIPATPAAPVAGATNAAAMGVVGGPPIDTLAIDAVQAERAVAAFARSCPALMRRTDASGLTIGSDWQGACAAAADVPPGGAIAFLSRWFEADQVGDGRAFATGYYIPEIAAARERRSGYDTPIYARPTDLVDVDLGQFAVDLKGRKIRGRVDRTNFVPYYDRSQIVGGAIDNRAPVLAWAADPVAFFFLQIQGSGILRLTDGSSMRIGYATQNGRDYTGIGALMKARGLLAPGQSSMQGIVAYLHAHPDDAARLMDENKSFVFFRVLDGDPPGALGYPVVGGVSAAVDTKFVPLGAPIFLSGDRADATRLWIAQDTGGGIKGANRIDTFWGSGADAEAIAGGMAARGTAFVLLPIGTLARLNGGSGGGTYPRR